MQKRRHIDAIMFFVLSFFLVFFYSTSLFQLDGAAVLLFFAGAAFLVTGLTVQNVMPKDAKQSPKYGMDAVIAASLGAAATFLLSTKLFGPVIAASLVGLVYAILAKPQKALSKLSRPVYCGAFVGMSAGIFSLGEIAFAGVLAGGIVIASQRIYKGTGGTLGTIAFIAMFLTKIFFGD